MTSRTAMRREHDRQESLDQIRKTPADRASHRRRLVLGAWAAGLVMIVALVVAGLLSARPTQSADARLAPGTLAEVQQHRAAAQAGQGHRSAVAGRQGEVGCDACLLQMNQIE